MGINARLLLAFIAAPLFIVGYALFFGRRLSIEMFFSWQLVFSSLVFYPICEEIIFRRVIQAGLMAREALAISFAGLSIANVITSLLFALTHLFVFRELGALLVFIPSLIFGYFYEKYRHVGFPIILHGWYNGVELLIS